MKRIAGMGNALTDMLVNLSDDGVLARYGLAKGSMNLVNADLQTEVSKAVAGQPYSLSLGGSADNTIRALASMGYRTGFIGEVGRDTTGAFRSARCATSTSSRTYSAARAARASAYRSSRPTANARC